MIIKIPFVVSTSMYNVPTVVWRKVSNPAPAAGLCRASLGTPEWNGRHSYDESFQSYWPQWDEMGLPRCAYHFAIKDDNPLVTFGKQARHYVSQLSKAGGWKPGDRVGLDIDDEYNVSARAIVDWFYNVLQLIPGLAMDDLLLYSRRNVMGWINWNQVTSSDQAFLQQIRQWTAGYPDEPDHWTFKQLVEAYQFDRAHFGPCVLVQYAAAAVVEGISVPGNMSVECNAIDPAYLEDWQARTRARGGAGQLPPTGGTMYQYEVTPAGSTYVNVRVDHNASATDIGDLPVGKRASGNEIWDDGTTSEKWLHALELDGQPIDGWIAIVHNGQTICTVSVTGSTTPPKDDQIVVDVSATINGQLYKASDIPLVKQ